MCKTLVLFEADPFALQMRFWVIRGSLWKLKVRSLWGGFSPLGDYQPLAENACRCLFLFSFFFCVGFAMVSMMSLTLLVGVCFRVIGVDRPVLLQSADDARPNIELGLVPNHECACAWVVVIVSLAMQAPPLHVWPQVAAEIGQLTDSRERMENANMDKLQQEFNKAEAEARRRIGNAIGKAMRAFDDPLLARSILIGRLVMLLVVCGLGTLLLVVLQSCACVSDSLPATSARHVGTICIVRQSECASCQPTRSFIEDKDR